MAIKRGVTRGDAFVQILNAAIQDQRLSYRARGVLAAVLSRPKHWRGSAEVLAEDSPREGRKAIQVALRELEEAGYLKRVKRQQSSGHWQTDWVITDDPRLVNAQAAPKVDLGTSVDSENTKPLVTPKVDLGTSVGVKPQVTPKVDFRTSVNRPSVDRPSVKGPSKDKYELQIRGGDTNTVTSPGHPKTSEPPQKCEQHKTNPNPPACGACAEARRNHETWKTNQPTPGPNHPMCPHHPTHQAARCPKCETEAVPPPIDLREHLRKRDVA